MKNSIFKSEVSTTVEIDQLLNNCVEENNSSTPHNSSRSCTSNISSSGFGSSCSTGDSGCAFQTPSGLRTRSKLLLSETTPVYHPEKRNRNAPKRKLFKGVEDQENASENNCNSKNNGWQRDFRRVVPLSERQQLALLLQLSSANTNSGINPSSQATPPSSASCTKQLPFHLSCKWRRLHKRNERGETPLHLAAIKGDNKKVTSLIRQRVDVNAKDFAGWTPLHEACNHGWLKICHSLLKAGADPNACGLGNDTPLHDAAVNSHYSLVSLLLQYGANPLQKNCNSKTALDVARSKKVACVLKEFCEKKQSVQNIKVGGETELARQFGNSSEPSADADSVGSPVSPSILPGQTTMRKNSSHSQTQKGAEKPTSPRLTLRFQSIKSKDEKSIGTCKTNDVSSSQPKYQTYCVTMETRDSHEFKKDDTSVSSTQSLNPAETGSSFDSKTDVVSSTCGSSNSSSSSGSGGGGGGGGGAAGVGASASAGTGAAVENNTKNNLQTVNNIKNRRDAVGDGFDGLLEKADSTDLHGGKVNGGRISNEELSGPDFDYSSDTVKEESRSKRRKSSDSSGSSKNNFGQRSHRNQNARQQSEGEQRSPKNKKKGSLSNSDTESTQSDNEVEKAAPVSEPQHNLSQNGSPNSGPHSPKVPPLKIVLTLGISESEPRERSKVSSSKQGLPYVISATSEQGENSSTGSPDTSTTAEGKDNSSKQDSVSSSLCSTPGKLSKEENSHQPEERFQRVTRSSQRMQAAMANANSSVTDGLNSASCSQKNEQSGESSTDEHHMREPDLHPRKRKLRTRDNGETLVQQQQQQQHQQQQNSSFSFYSTSSSASTSDDSQQQLLNCYQMFLNIRKQVDKRRKSMLIVHPKPPQGFRDYLLNRCSYVLEGNAASRISVPTIPPPQSLTGSMKDLFIQQEKERYKLRLQHLIEREKLVLSAEQEILRVHGRAARAMANQTVPLSVCTILKDEEIYNILEEDKDKNVRSRYNGRLFLSWLQDVDDKWEKIKEATLLRHHNEAESLHAVQKLDWEWKMKELAMCDVKSTPVIDDIYVPMVHVSDDFDLLPA